LPVPPPALSPAQSSSSIVPVGGTSSPPGRVQTDLTAAVGVLDIMRPLNTSGRAGPSERTTAPPPVPPPIVPPKEDPKGSPVGATDKAGSHSTGSFAPDPPGPSVGAFDQAADEKEKPTSGLSGGPAVTPSTSASG